VERAVGQLRRRRAYQAIRKALEVSLGRSDFRVIHVSVQREHIHLIVEAASAMALAKGMQALGISAARRLTRRSRSSGTQSAPGACLRTATMRAC